MANVYVRAEGRPERPGRAPPRLPHGSARKRGIRRAPLPGLPPRRPGAGRVGRALPDPACRIPLRSPKWTAWLSALVPGVGDIYLRHFLLGSLEFVGSIAVLCFALFAIVAAVATRDSEVLFLAAVLGILSILLPRLFDFFLTLHMGRKGIVPLSLTPAPPGVEDGAPIGPSRGASLPAFPTWSWLHFAAGALAVGATAWFSLAEARASARVLEACRLAETGKVAEARKLYVASAAAKPAAPSDRGPFALALWEGGDLDGGDLLVTDLGPIDREVADRLDAFVANHEAALNDLEDGHVALLDGKAESAWEQIDRAVALFATLENAPPAEEPVRRRRGARGRVPRTTAPRPRRPRRDAPGRRREPERAVNRRRSP